MRSQSYSSDGALAYVPAAVPAGGKGAARAYARAALETARPYQWVKNVLVFIPLAAVHRLGDWRLLADATLAFAAFTLCAAGVYVLNDLIDAPADRQHPHKCCRPLAAGRLPRGLAAAMVPLLICAALATGTVVDIRVALVLALYLAMMTAYTLSLRAIVLLDALILAIGYALRVAVGAFAVDVSPSSWLLAFCVFLFFSLALIKRYAELALMQRLGHSLPQRSMHARGYLPGDQSFVLALGVSTGTLAVLVLYLSAAASAHYSRAGFIMVVCVLLLYWLSHMWLTAYRGFMSDDPLIFALKDRVSRALVVLMGVAAWLAV